MTLASFVGMLSETRTSPRLMKNSGKNSGKKNPHSRCCNCDKYAQKSMFGCIKLTLSVGKNGHPTISGLPNRQFISLRYVSLDSKLFYKNSLLCIHFHFQNIPTSFAKSSQMFCSSAATVTRSPSSSAFLLPAERVRESEEA